LVLSAISSNTYSKVLAEPNLVTLNGRPASFVAGGQFAVPTVVGIGGVGAGSTRFQSFGTQIFFTPAIIDKDRIRLNVTPTFSTVNSGLAVNGIPGLNTRTVSTTVDLREGQWLALAGLIEDTQAGGESRVPLLGDLPGLGLLFSGRNVDRQETELIILVSPEIVHALEPEEVPLLLPGMEITEPNNWDLYVHGRVEGDPRRHFRSTIWPLERERMLAAHREALSKARSRQEFQECQEYYVHGPVGFSE
jgi:pilus assembly protein CpaC